MHESNLRSVDLNLLKVLNEIERQGSVTAAAEVLGLGQPAVSQALSRLRLTLKDDLFQRGPKGMTPTPKMQALIGPLRMALGQIEETLFGVQAFDVATTQTRFLVGASDYAAAIVTPSMHRALVAHMPNATLSIRRADRSDAEKLLSNGDIDIALGLFPKKSDWIKTRRLYQERHVCVFNQSLLHLPDPLPLTDYVAHDHLLVSLDGSARGFVDDILQKEGVERRVALTTPFFLQAPSLLEHLPLIATLPEKFVRQSSILSKLAIRSLPFESPGFPVSVAWRSGDDLNPRISALCDLVLKAGYAR
ncbi:MAG: LysR substrate-binding domain-containing protein [Pseudomonadota bacterium]